VALGKHGMPVAGSYNQAQQLKQQWHHELYPSDHGDGERARNEEECRGVRASEEWRSLGVHVGSGSEHNLRGVP
jgi:hypothetical protein